VLLVPLVAYSSTLKMMAVYSRNIGGLLPDHKSLHPRRRFFAKFINVASSFPSENIRVLETEHGAVFVYKVPVTLVVVYSTLLVAQTGTFRI
jgi:hypothetical protein